MLNVGEIFGDYRIVRVLNRRRTGNLYQAVDRWGQPVGIQVFPWSFSGDKRSIWRMWSQTASLYSFSAKICPISRMDHVQDKVFLVTGLLDGSPLEYVIAGNPLEKDLTLSYAYQVALALQAAHGNGFLHLGLNPENIYVTSLGLQLLDFGLPARIPALFPEQAEEVRLAFEGSSTGGSRTYKSPEQAAGMAVDARSDLFSLGAVLYEMATGVPAFGSRQTHRPAERLLQNSPAPPRTIHPDIPPALEAIILKAIAREREQRYQSSAELIQDLLAIIDIPRLVTLKEFATAEQLLFDQLALDPQNAQLERSLREVEEQTKRVLKADRIRELCWQAEEAEGSKRYPEAIEIYTRAVNVDPSAEFLPAKKKQSPDDEERARKIREIKARISRLRSIANIKELPKWIDPGSDDQEGRQQSASHPNDTLGHYRIVRALRVGGETGLFEARDELTGRRVAIEILRASTGRTVLTLRDDMDLVGRLAHPNLCAVHEVGEYKGASYVVQDYLEGGYSLESVIDLGEMPPARRLEVVRQVCIALDYAHRSGLTGLDIIPSMVVLQRDGQVKLIDYWLAWQQKAIDANRWGETLNIRHKYLPPEEWKGARSPALVNTWAVGVLLYRMFSYRHPFSASDVTEVAANIQNQPLRPLANQLTICPPGLDGVLAKALAKDPNLRYQSAEAMAADLQSIIASLEPDARQPADTPPASSDTSSARGEGRSRPDESRSVLGTGGLTEASSTAKNSPAARQATTVPAPTAVPPTISNPSSGTDPIFGSPKNPPTAIPPLPSVNELLALLRSEGQSPGTPFRPEPAPGGVQPVSGELPKAPSGGVTQLLQRLAGTPAQAPSAPAARPPATPPASGPGEFTRLLSSAPPSSLSAEPATGIPQTAVPPVAPGVGLTGPLTPRIEPAPRAADPGEPSELLVLDRKLDLALAPSVPVLTPIEIRALVRLPSSRSLSELLNQELEPELSKSVRSHGFGLEFLRDSTGRLRPVDITMRIAAPDFEPPRIEKKVRVRPDRDSECQTFILTPKQTGVLLIQFDVLAGDITVASQGLKTQSETSGRLQTSANPVVVTVPLSVVVRPRRRWIWAAAALIIVALGVFFGIFRPSPHSAGDSRGSKPDPEQTSSGASVPGKNYALLFATDDYQYWPHLNNPLSDARTIAAELHDNYGYSDIPPRVVENPKTTEIVNILHAYAAKQYGPSDQLFIYFAGHGFFDEQERQGFLVGSDSMLQRDDTAHSSYLDFSRLAGMLNHIPIEHIFVVLDVCYGGAFDERVIKWAGQRGDEYADVAPEKFIRRKLAVKGRLYLASGEITTVPDGRPGQHSPFARRFIASLRNYGGKKQLVTASSIAVDVEKVDPEPKFGEFGDSAPGADFLFIPK